MEDCCINDINNDHIVCCLTKLVTILSIIITNELIEYFHGIIH